MRTSPLRMLALLGLSIAAATLAPAQAASATTISDITYAGRSASADWYDYSPDGCVEYATSVHASDGRSRDSVTGLSAGVSATVYSGAVDYCTGQTLYFDYGDAGLSPGQFTIDRTLATATLKATIPTYDYTSGEAVTLDINLTWAATSGPYVSSGIFHETFPDGSRLTDRSSGTFRDATAAGSVFDGTTNRTPDPTDDAQLKSVKNGSITLTR